MLLKGSLWMPVFIPATSDASSHCAAFVNNDDILSDCYPKQVSFFSSDSHSWRKLRVVILQKICADTSFGFSKFDVLAICKYCFSKQFTIATNSNLHRSLQYQLVSHSYQRLLMYILKTIHKQEQYRGG